MQLLKISAVFLFTISLCSFAYYHNIEDGREQAYKDFLAEFDPIEVPNTVELKIIKEASNNLQKEKSSSKKPQISKKVLGMKYSAFIPGVEQGMVSRMGPSTYAAEVMLASANNKYQTVIYSITRPYDRQAKSYTIATFDQEGNPVSSQSLGYASIEKMLKLNVNAKMEITVKDHVLDSKVDGAVKVNKDKKMFITPKGEILVHNNKGEVEQLEFIKMKKTPTKKRVG